MANDEILKELFSLKDEKYKEFSSSLMPTVNKETVIGVRTPQLRKFAKKLYKEKQYESFLRSLPHHFFEENNLHAFIIAEIKDFEKCVFETEKLLPFIDNWATCDGLRPLIFKKESEKLLPYINKWLKSEHTYTIRFGVQCLMNYFLDEKFEEEYLKTVSEIKSEEYYVNMMIAWYFATALAKRYESALPYIEKRLLSLFVHKKTIQKAIESYRLNEEQKAYLKTLRDI